MDSRKLIGIIGEVFFAVPLFFWSPASRVSFRHALEGIVSSSTIGLDLLEDLKVVGNKKQYLPLEFLTGLGGSSNLVSG